MTRYVPRMTVTDSLPLFELPDKPDYSIEASLCGNGAKAIAGIDEVGRGPLAGPVVAAAVIIDPSNIPNGLNDSKKISEKRREALFSEICLTSHVAWASIPAEEIDRINIRQAALMAMTLSAQRLAITPDVVIVDGRDVPPALTSIGSAYVKGDARSVSIAAASIVAKVIRDRMMIRADLTYPQYSFAEHKGYGSKKHRDAIHQYGACPLHRRSFSPIKDVI